MKRLNQVQKQRLDQYFEGSEIDQDYYDFVSSIIEEDGFIDEEMVNDYEQRKMG